VRNLIIFIKNPLFGKVKTRLARDAGNESALEIYNYLLSCTRKIADASDASRYLMYSDYVNFTDEWPNTIYNKQVQTGSDLGERMYNAFSAIHKPGDKTLIIGSDCPFLTPAIINDAYIMLDAHDLVFGPSEDGGYYLLGMKSIFQELFENIEWSTKKVLEQSIQSIEGKNLRYSLLPVLNDIDTLADWQNYLALQSITL
jgi:uncharacterized protein